MYTVRLKTRAQPETKEKLQRTNGDETQNPKCIAVIALEKVKHPKKWSR